ncbi:YjgF-like protein [Atractiella rhizophila]|nr:YjgF-like protein [Atractiella rhizophila]
MSSYGTISTANAPQALGPYSQATKAGGLIFTSAQGGFDHTTMTLVPGGVEAQAKKVLENMTAIVRAGGSDIQDIVKVTDLNDFAKVNAVYAEWFGEHKPARSAVEVAKLPAGCLIGMECIAIAKN